MPLAALSLLCGWLIVTCLPQLLHQLQVLKVGVVHLVGMLQGVRLSHVPLCTEHKTSALYARPYQLSLFVTYQSCRFQLASSCCAQWLGSETRCHGRGVAYINTRQISNLCAVLCGCTVTSRQYLVRFNTTASVQFVPICPRFWCS